MPRVRTKVIKEYYYFTIPKGWPKDCARIEETLTRNEIESDLAISESECRCYRVAAEHVDRLPGEFPRHGIPLDPYMNYWHENMYDHNPIPVIYKNWKPIHTGGELQLIPKRRRRTNNADIPTTTTRRSRKRCA